MAKIDATKLWTLQYRLVSSVIVDVAAAIDGLGLGGKELFVLAAIDENPHPAELAGALCIPKPTVTVYLKHLEAAGLVKREIDPSDLRKHRITLTAAGRKVTAKGMGFLSEAFGGRLERLSAQDRACLQTVLEKMS